MLRGCLPCEQPIDTVVVMVVPQLGNRTIPVLVGWARDRERFLIGFGDDDLAHNADLRRRDMTVKSARIVPVQLPRSPIRINVLAHCRGWAQSDEIEAVPGSKSDAIRIMRRVPQ